MVTMVVVAEGEAIATVSDSNDKRNNEKAAAATERGVLLAEDLVGGNGAGGLEGGEEFDEASPLLCDFCLFSSTWSGFEAEKHQGDDETGEVTSLSPTDEEGEKETSSQAQDGTDRDKVQQTDQNIDVFTTEEERDQDFSTTTLSSLLNDSKRQTTTGAAAPTTVKNKSKTTGGGISNGNCSLLPSNVSNNDTKNSSIPNQSSSSSSPARAKEDKVEESPADRFPGTSSSSSTATNKMAETEQEVVSAGDGAPAADSSDDGGVNNSSSSDQIVDAHAAAAALDASVRTSNYVYVRSEEYAWVPGRLISTSQSPGEGADDDGADSGKSKRSVATVSIPQYQDEQDIQSDGGRGALKRKPIQKTVNLEDYPNRALPLQNVDENGHLRQVEDMVDLPFLHEAAILFNLKQRHKQGKPYTRTGDIVIACNPYKWYNDLYTENKRNLYAQALVWDRDDEAMAGGGEKKDDGGTCDPRSRLEPHVYEASSLAYRGLAVEGDDQSILVSGESGAGKTETVKILLSDLASVQRGVHGDGDDAYSSPIVQRVLDSNPLLEAFGNAKTVRNDNSSRFGKYIQLQFDVEDPMSAAYAGKTVPRCVLAGSKCEVYLLEKSRVTHHEEEERTYHIFYQLLAAPEERKVSFWDGLKDTDSESFSYVGYTDTDSIEGISDAERFEQTVQSLALVGVKDEKLMALIRAICMVLQLGNLIFVSDPTDESKSIIVDGDDEDSEGVTSDDGETETEEDGKSRSDSKAASNSTTTRQSRDLQRLSELMGVTCDDLTAALTIRTVRARGEEFKVPLNEEKAKDSCDAFAKEIYAKSFLWLVRTINDATSAELNYDGAANIQRYGLIGMLDIFGFETFETNRFEQLCINYANEKLQQKFTQDIFRSVQAEYEYEGIELGEITYDDNTDVLDLVEGRMGLLAFLNEECVRPGGNDKGFVMKARAMNKESPCFISEKSFTAFEFGIRHYAGSVVYDAANFVTKNMDTLPSDLQACARQSTNPILADELDNEAMMNPVQARGGSSPSATAPPSPKTRKKRRPPSSKNKKASAVVNSKASPSSLAAAPSDGPKKKQQSNLIGDTVWTKFKHQLSDLMTNLKKTRTRYIRCIKPNTHKQPLVMQHLSTIEQLRCAGVVAAVTISRSAFPNRLEHKIILYRFKSLWSKGEHLAALAETEELAGDFDADVRSSKLVSYLLSSSLKSLEVEREDGGTTRAFVMGRTRAYFRAGALEFLEAERVKRLGIWAVEMQRIGRGYLAHARYARLRELGIKLQALARERSARRRYVQWRSSATMLECWYRCIAARLTLRQLIRNHKATLIQTHWRMAVAMVMLKTNRQASVVIQTMVRGSLQRPKYRIAIHEKREEAKLENQVLALQRKLEEAEAKRVEAEKMAEEKARRAVEEYREEKKDSVGGVPSSVPSSVISSPDNSAAEEASAEMSLSTAARGQLSAQQQHLMDESGKMLEYLRKEVFKLRSQNSQMRTDLDLLKDNNQRLMDANASAGASFAALNQHTKHLSKANDKLTKEVTGYRHQVQKLNVTQVELKEELKMKQATYVAEVQSRLQFQKALAAVVDMVQERCRDTRLVENVLRVADACEEEYMSGPTGLDQSRGPATFRSPGKGVAPPTTPTADNNDSSSGLMSSIRSLWS